MSVRLYDEQQARGGLPPWTTARAGGEVVSLAFPPAAGGSDAGGAQ